GCSLRAGSKISAAATCDEQLSILLVDVHFSRADSGPELERAAPRKKGTRTRCAVVIHTQVGGRRDRAPGGQEGEQPRQIDKRCQNSAVRRLEARVRDHFFPPWAANYGLIGRRAQQLKAKPTVVR